MKQEIPDKLISKNLTGESTSDEDAALWTWIESNEQNQKIFDMAVAAYSNEDFTVSKFDIERTLAKIVIGPVYVISSWWSLAACVSLVSILSSLIFLTNSTVIVSTPRGQVKHHTLPDLSQVWLNGGSRISYDARSYGKDRVLVLEGEAYFKIIDSNNPFVIIYDSIKASTHGGELNIQAYNDAIEKVCVVGDGMVEFEDQRKKNLILSVSTDAEVVSRSDYGLLSATVNRNINFNSWLTGIYAFEDEPMKSIFSLVNKGNDFALPALSTQWGHRRISGVFEFDGSSKAFKNFIAELSRRSSPSREQL